MFIKKIKTLIKKTLFLLNCKKPWSIGYYEHKFELILNTIKNNTDKTFSKASLPLNYGSGFDERVVEYPWFFEHLDANAEIILDAGSTLNHACILNLPALKDKKLSIVTLAPEVYQNTDKEKKISYIYEDLRSLSNKEDSIDLISCISTLEHVGLDNTQYTSNNKDKLSESESYLDVIKEFKRILKKDGRALLTIPFGQHKKHGFLQVFDQQMIDSILKTFVPSEFQLWYYKYENHMWNLVDEKECVDSIFCDTSSGSLRNQVAVAAQCVCCIKLIK